MKNSKIEVLSDSQIDAVFGGGFWVHWAAGSLLTKAVTEYADWVSNGAGGWTETYNGTGYNDPLL